MAHPSNAQNSRDRSTLILTDDRSDYTLGQHIFITKDAEESFDFSDIIERRNNNTRGERQNTKILNLGISGSAHWLTFDIINQSQKRDWVLDFGSSKDGRVGLIKKIHMYDFARQKLFFNSSKDNVRLEKEALNGTALPITLEPGSKASFILYIKPDSSAPLLLPLEFKTEKKFIQDAYHFFQIEKAVFSFLLIIAAFFFSSMILNKILGQGLFILYYLSLAAIIVWQNNALLTPFDDANKILATLIAASMLCGIAITYNFLSFDSHDKKENTIFIGTAASIILGIAAAFLVPLPSDIYVMALLYVPTIASAFIVCSLSYTEAKNDKPAAYLFTFGWLFFAAGLSGSIMAISPWVVSTTITNNLFWFAIFPQAFFFIWASMEKARLIKTTKKKLKIKENEEERAIAKLKETKEVADNARLLKVIEHEREMLAELKESEARRTEEMRLAKDAADEANMAKSAFLAVVSHEIRTPMNGIMGMVKLLMNTKLTKEQKEFADTIQDSADAMLGLLNDILDFEKIERGKMDLEQIPFDLHRLVNGVITLMSGHAQQKNIELKAHVDENLPRHVKGDPTRLRQILLNLTSNAIKFTKHGDVTLHARKTEQEGVSQESQINEIYFAVQDTGIGISQKAQKNLFSPFAQADSSISRNFGGSGLGLAISKGLVEAMGSTINVRSQINEGSTFFFSLNMDDADAELGQTEVSKTLNTKPQQATVEPVEKAMHILVVDDNDINTRVIQGLLGQSGHTFHIAHSAEECLEIIQENSFDLILMDVQLGGMRGDDATRVIRNLPDEKTRQTPVIALTGNVMPEDIQGYYNAGMNGFIPKPIDPKHFQDILIKAQNKDFENKLQQNTTSEDIPMKEPESPLEIDPGNQEQSPLSAFVKNQNADDLVHQEPVSADSSDDIFNTDTLNTLKRSLEREELNEMIGNLLEKTDEIVGALSQAAQMRDYDEIIARAHELKGMAGNFGLIEISEIARRAEQKAKTQKLEELPGVVADLPSAKERAQQALQSWMAA